LRQLRSGAELWRGGWGRGQQGFFEPDGEGIWRVLLHYGGKDQGPARRCGVASAPGVDLAGGDADQPGEAGLAAVGCGQEPCERGLRVSIFLPGFS